MRANVATAPMNTLLVNLRRSVQAWDGPAKTDGELLESFITRRDEAAFAALVRRHGPMVLGVCHRLLGNAEDAEDAFQATYLVLARKAASVRPRELVGNWLHGVAIRTAQRARALTAKRKSRERQVVAMPEPAVPPQDLWHDLRPLIDQELGRLPDIYRAPILLCDLEGKSIKDATRHLGWPQGTLAGRLARGRKLLAQRLARRGLVFSGGTLSATLAQHASAALTPTLAHAAAAAAVRFATGATAGPAVSAAVLALAKGVMNMMLLSKLKVPFGLVLVAVGALVLSGLTRSEAAKAHASAAPHAALQGAPTKKETEEPAWKKDFRGKYGLKEGEHVKRIATPYPACRTDYLADRFARPAGAIAFDDHFTVLRWKGDWAPAELAQHTLPVKQDEGVALSRLLNMTAGLSRIRLRGDDEVLEWKVTGDFVVRDGAAQDQIVAQLENLLNKECALAVTFRFKEVEDEVFVISGAYESKPLDGRGKNQIEIYAIHLTDRSTGGGGSGVFAEFLAHVEGHVNRRVLAGKIEGLPKSVSWHYNVRSPTLKDPNQGIDTRAEDTNPQAVLANVAAQTGLVVNAEKRKVQVLEVTRSK
ncbi:MAG: hypothetical protein L0Y70_23460 [Gemmataceae bacterium]|nr:hypothetical protein [Gemmataceae bacterium]